MTFAIGAAGAGRQKVPELKLPEPQRAVGARKACGMTTKRSGQPIGPPARFGGRLQSSSVCAV